jgi:hypothetical protein
MLNATFSAVTAYSRTLPTIAAGCVVVFLTLFVNEPAAALAHTAAAQPRTHNRLLLAQANQISRDEAASAARRATGGRVVGVKKRGAVYFVRVLLDGERVRTVKVDARTGQVRD